MTWAFLGNGLYTCKSTDTKVTVGVTTDSGCIEWNTGKMFQFNGTSWDETLTNSTTLRLLNEAVEPTATTTSTPVYRHDIDVNNQAIYVSRLENGVAVKFRLAWLDRKWHYQDILD